MPLRGTRPALRNREEQECVLAPTGMRAEHASVAVDLDCKPESARLKPKRRIPRDQRRYQRRNEQKVGVSRSPVLCLVAQHYLTKWVLDSENPFGYHYVHRV